jgi:NADH-quinone oxidoreductase subunit I
MSLLTAIRDTCLGLKSLVIGMRITAREAARPSITVQYPRETLKMPDRFRGHIKLLIDPETGKPRCTACTLCAKACPSGCIVLDGVKREGDKKKSVSKYELDFTTCSLCGSCVEICPSDAIDFSKEYNVVSLDRGTFEHMDLYAKLEADARAWAEANPEKAAAAVASAAAAAAAPKPVASVPAAGAATPSPAKPRTGDVAVSAPPPSRPETSTFVEQKTP